MKLKRLTLQDFERLAGGTRMKERTKQLAQDVLVDGKTVTEVAARAGMTPQRIGLAVGVIEKAYFENPHGGLGWVTLDMELPEAIALRLDELAQLLKASDDEAMVEQVSAVVMAALIKARRLLGVSGK